MKYFELTLTSGNKATFFVNSNMALIDGTDGVRLNDGIHNNGGWKVKGSYEDTLKKIRNAKEL